MFVQPRRLKLRERHITERSLEALLLVDELDEALDCGARRHRPRPVGPSGPTERGPGESTHSITLVLPSCRQLSSIRGDCRLDSIFGQHRAVHLLRTQAAERLTDLLAR